MAQAEVGDLFIKTPLIRSDILSSKLGASVWLKLENLQNACSFKVRGISNLCKHVRIILFIDIAYNYTVQAVENGCNKFISSSGNVL